MLAAGVLAIAAIVFVLIALGIALLVGTSPAEQHRSAPNPSQQPLPFTAQLVATGFDSPVGMAQRPGFPGQYYVWEQQGLVTLLSAGKRRVVLDLREDLLGTDGLHLGGQGDERGLLGLAFAPPAVDENAVYVVYTAPPPSRASTLNNILTLRRYTIGEDGTFSGPVNILEIPQRESYHNGGTLAFSPHDSLLYMSVGDGGPQKDPEGHAQDAFDLHGKLLRIDVSRLSGNADAGTRRYRIPSDNPFADGRDGAPEVIALGLRNPWRFSIDLHENRVFIGDVGFNHRESVKIAAPPIRGDGKPYNFGWNVHEGDVDTLFRDTRLRRGDEWTPPAFAYDTSLADIGRAIVGGYVVRTPSELYLFADYVTGVMAAIEPASNNDKESWRLRYKSTPEQWLPSEAPERNVVVPAMASDLSGNVYVIAVGKGASLSSGGRGSIYRLTPTRTGK